MKYPKGSPKTRGKHSGKIKDRVAAVTQDNECRCKEISKKTPRELLRTMLQDLLPIIKKK